jgi:VanZ family protein
MTTSLKASLRYPRAWLAAGLLMATVITIACLVPARELPSLGVSDKFEHGFAFFVLAIWFAGVLSRRDFIYLALALVAFGGSIEIAQGLMGLGREADIRDLTADALGVGAGILLALTPLGRWAMVVESLFTSRKA